MDDTVGVSKINSCQNGYLSANVHQLFDQYLLLMNPDVECFLEIRYLY